MPSGTRKRRSSTRSSCAAEGVCRRQPAGAAEHRSRARARGHHIEPRTRASSTCPTTTRSRSTVPCGGRRNPLVRWAPYYWGGPRSLLGERLLLGRRHPRVAGVLLQCFDWHRCSVIVKHDHYHRHRPGYNQVGKAPVWKHDPKHRRGVVHNNRGSTATTAAAAPPGVATGRYTATGAGRAAETTDVRTAIVTGAAVPENRFDGNRGGNRYAFDGCARRSLRWLSGPAGRPLERSPRPRRTTGGESSGGLRGRGRPATMRVAAHVPTAAGSAPTRAAGRDSMHQTATGRTSSRRCRDRRQQRHPAGAAPPESRLRESVAACAEPCRSRFIITASRLDPAERHAPVRDARRAIPQRAAAERRGGQPGFTS